AQYRERILPVINCLIAAKEPLDESFLIKSTSIEDSIAGDTLLSLSQFLNRTEMGVRFFHQSISEWLSKRELSTIFSASKSRGENLLADICWSEFEAGLPYMSTYSRMHIAIHLAETGRWSELNDVVTNSEFGLIRIWTEGGQGKNGITCLKGLVEYLLINKKDSISAAGFSTQLARIYSFRGDYAGANKYLKLASRKTNLFYGRRIKAVALHELASLSYYERDLYNSSKKYKKALRISKWGGKVLYDEAASNLIGLATIAWDSYQFKRAIKLSERAKDCATKASDLHHLVAAERLIGTIHKRIGNIQEASFHLSNALDMCDLGDLKREKYRILLLQGWLELDIAAMNNTISEKARPLFKQAHEGAKYLIDHYFITEALLSIEWTFIKEKNTSSARHYHNLAQSELVPHASPELRISGDVRLVCIYYLNKEHDKAMDLGIDLINNFKKLNIRTRQSTILTLLGAIQWYRNNNSDAEKYWTEALETARSISEKRETLATLGIEMCKKDPLWIPQ
ncbi:MAG: hypothetical protein DRI98_13910, partial [Bacteroidetes bacterium]